MSIWSLIMERGLLTRTFPVEGGGPPQPLSSSVILHWIITRHGPLFTLALLCGLLGAVMLVFFLMHLWQVLQNKTTAESYRWQDVKDFINSPPEDDGSSSGDAGAAAANAPGEGAPAWNRQLHQQVCCSLSSSSFILGC